MDVSENQEVDERLGSILQQMGGYASEVKTGIDSVLETVNSNEDWKELLDWIGEDTGFAIGWHRDLMWPKKVRAGTLGDLAGKKEHKAWLQEQWQGYSDDLEAVNEYEGSAYDIAMQRQTVSRCLLAVATDNWEQAIFKAAWSHVWDIVTALRMMRDRAGNKSLEDVIAESIGGEEVVRPQ